MDVVHLVGPFFESLLDLVVDEADKARIAAQWHTTTFYSIFMRDVCIPLTLPPKTVVEMARTMPKASVLHCSVPAGGVVRSLRARRRRCSHESCSARCWRSSRRSTEVPLAVPALGVCVVTCAVWQKCW
jgi:hypothetical protein